MLSTDFVVTVPFILSDALPSEVNTLPPSYWVWGACLLPRALPDIMCSIPRFNGCFLSREMTGI
jgi:hypothetical protein